MQAQADGTAARLVRGVAPTDVAIAAGALVASFILPPGGQAGTRAGFDPVELGGRAWPSAALVVLAGLLLLWRRQRPVAVWCAVLLLTAADTLLTGLPSRCLPVLMVSVYSAALRTDRRTTTLIAAATAVTLIVPTILVTGAPIGSDATYALAAFSALAAAVGDSVRSQHEAVRAALDRAAAAEASREEEARRRVAEERLRIARELHDAVAHHVSVISVQAGVASHLLQSDPSGARAALIHVRTASQQVIDEMRMMVGLLRTDDNAQLVEPPAPGLHDVPALVDRMRSAGLDISVEQDAVEEQVPTTIGLTAYRVVQEALTNAARYGTGTAQVMIGGEVDRLRLEVTNPVASPATGPGTAGHSNGLGLVGMRERVAAAGGSLTITPGRSFVVRADLPLNPVTR
jgi:signal transduction histidine kinase